MSRIRRIGLSWEPPDGWPLDRLLVGVATLRSIREFLRAPGSSRRGWDLHLRSGVSVQGSTYALERMEREGLAFRVVVDPWSAPGYGLDLDHPLVPALRKLFEDERASVRSAWPDRARP